MAVVAATMVAFVAGCGGEGAGKQEVSTQNPSAEKIAALEKDVARLRNEVQLLRHQVEVEAKMRSRAAMPSFSRRSGRPGPDGRFPEDMQNGEFPPRRPPVMREDPAKMTPEQRRAWHEERRKMIEERKRGKISNQGKQANPDTKEGEKK